MLHQAHQIQTDALTPLRQPAAACATLRALLQDHEVVTRRYTGK